MEGFCDTPYNPGMDNTSQIALWADTLRDISASGLKYALNVYDKDRYTATNTIAKEMFQWIIDTDDATLHELKSAALSHPTPITVADAAIIDEKTRILLIQRSDNKKWAMPGGYLEVGETPAEGALREALEETGVQATSEAFVGVYDSRRCGTIFPHHLYIFTFLCRPGAKPKQPPSHGHEVLDTAWFGQTELPKPLSSGHEVRIRDAFKIFRGEGIPHADLDSV